MTGENIFEKITPENMFETGDLKILICYVLSTIKEAVPATELAQLFHYEGIANYFEVQTAIYELEKSGYIKLENSKEQLFVITDEGKKLSVTLRDSVSATLRGKVYNAVVKMLARYKTERDTNITLTRVETGCSLTCKIASGGCDFLSFSILLPNEAQAGSLKEKILKNPSYYYDSLITLLTEENG